jgi:hypothetical protein
MCEPVIRKGITWILNGDMATRWTVF